MSSAPYQRTPGILNDQKSRCKQVSEFRSANGKCRPGCRPIVMTGRQKITDLQFLIANIAELKQTELKQS